MRRKKIDGRLERRFLIAMITSKSFLASAAPFLDPELFQATFVRRVVRWCVEYWEKYSDAPGRSIEAIFRSWVETEEQDESEVKLIEDLLGELSVEADQDESLNVQYLLDELGRYLSIRKLGRLQETVEGYLIQGQCEEAVREVTEFTSVRLGQGQGFDPLRDHSVWERAFAEPAEPLFTFGGDAGRFLNRALVRDGLLGIQGPEKRGKTYACLEFALRALQSRRRVAFFEVGDLSEAQIMLRLGTRLTGQPRYKDQLGEIEVPVKIRREKDSDGKEDIEVETQTRTCDRTVNRRSAIRACRRFIRRCGFGKVSHFMVSIHPNDSINVKGIEGILERWQHELEFVPDLVVIDYADILAPEKGRKDARDQVNDTWKALRRMSQERHCLVIAPTQAAARSYDADVQSMTHFSEDKRKLAHVTAMLGLNQRPEEKERGLMRFNWIVLREAEFMTKRCLWVAQCMSLARPFCCATL